MLGIRFEAIKAAELIARECTRAQAATESEMENLPIRASKAFLFSSSSLGTRASPRASTLVSFFITVPRHYRSSTAIAVQLLHESPQKPHRGSDASRGVQKLPAFKACGADGRGGDESSNRNIGSAPVVRGGPSSVQQIQTKVHGGRGEKAPARRRNGAEEAATQAASYTIN